MNNNEKTGLKQDVNKDKKTKEQVMNESGIDYIWGSDQDELVQKQEKGE